MCFSTSPTIWASPSPFSPFGAAASSPSPASAPSALRGAPPARSSRSEPFSRTMFKMCVDARPNMGGLPGSDFAGGRKRFGGTASASKKKISAPVARAPGMIHRSTSLSFAKISRTTVRTSPGLTRSSSLSPSLFTNICENPSFLHFAAFALQIAQALGKSLMKRDTSSRALSIADDAGVTTSAWPSDCFWASREASSACCSQSTTSCAA
mmetsp:Transcript_89861/g.275084  ORF Transcript_89861/g.275084 Transcript_89861/m.275084 type:complete len:210 (+) Transcript_89861:4657-5286(+)